MSNDQKHNRLMITSAIIGFVILLVALFYLSPNNFPQTNDVTPTSQVIKIPTVSMTPVSLPSFPWPVPKPSAFEVLTLESLGWDDETEITFQDVDERITSALDSAGYYETSYFGVPGGFAIVTRLEKMDTNGYPDFLNRWMSSLEPISIEDFSLTKYLDALFGVPKGQYRVFVFVVSSESVIQSGTPVAKEEAQTWIVEGANKLPSQMKELPYTNEHTTTVYIYEFIQSGVGEAASYSIPSDFTGRQHLERAGLLDSLNADCEPNLVLREITYGSVVRNSICPSGTNDNFRFYGTSGDEIELQIKTTDKAIVICMDLDLITPDFHHIFFHCGSEIIAATLENTGHYYLKIYSVEDIAMIYDYTLTLERVP